MNLKTIFRRALVSIAITNREKNKNRKKIEQGFSRVNVDSIMDIEVVAEKIHGNESYSENSEKETMEEKNVKNSKNWTIISSKEDLRQVGSNKDLKKKIMLAGSALILTLDEPESDDEIHGIKKDFVFQPARRACSLVQWILKGNSSKKLYVGVSRSLMNSINENYRIGYAVDGVLNYGIKESAQKNKKGKENQVAVLTGSGNDFETIVQALVFVDGSCVEIYERKFPSVESYQFNEFFSAFRGQLLTKYALIDKIKVSAPLPDLKNDTEYLSDSVIKNTVFKPLENTGDQDEMGGQKQVSKKEKLIPIGLVGLGILAYSGLVGWGKASYDASVSRYQETSSDPVFSKGVDTGLMSIYQARAAWSKEKEFRMQKLISLYLSKILSGVSDIKDARIQLLKMPADGANLDRLLVKKDGLINGQIQGAASITPPPMDAPADFSLIVNVPSDGASFLDQATAILSFLSQKTGFTLRLSQQQNVDTQKESRDFVIEGIIK